MIVAVVGRRCRKTIVSEYVEAEKERRFHELIETVERLLLAGEGEPKDREIEEEPEDNETLGGYHCPCNRQNPGGHRIPWYTAGFT